jgi:predicted amidohydrolase
MSHDSFSWHDKAVTDLPTISYIASSPAESVSLARPMETSPFVLGLRKAAKESALAINVGIHVPASEGKLSNRSCWINERGDIEAVYDKLHLFDYGALKESNSVEAGKSIVPPVDTVVGRVGLTICFDVPSSPTPDFLHSSSSDIT